MIGRELRLVLVAVQFLTRIPVPALPQFEADWLDRSVKYFPLVGVLVGTVSATVLLAASLVLPGPLPALLAVAAGVIATGALHEDGVADTADGLGGGTTRQRRLEIMKDSRIGTYGATALGLTLAIKVAALAALPSMLAAAALVVSHALARLAPVAMIAVAPYAGDADAAKVKPLANGVRPGEFLLATATALIVPAVLLPIETAAITVIGAMIPAAVVGALAWRSIGGYTGDNLGAMEQAAEVGILLAIVAATRA